MPISQKTKRAIAKYGLDACLDAFQMNEEGEGASTIAFSLQGTTPIKTTRQADAAIDAGREIDGALSLTLKASYYLGEAKVEFTVSYSEWRDEMPAVFGCYSLPQREYQLRAVYKKAEKLAGRKVDAIQF